MEITEILSMNYQRLIVTLDSINDNGGLSLMSQVSQGSLTIGK